MSKITEKIAKLLALAESPYEEEAKAALLQARRLMAEHKLMPEDIEPQENKKVVQECVGVTCTKFSSPWTVYLSTLIAAHYCCRPYRSSVHGGKVSEIGFIGMEDHATGVGFMPRAFRMAMWALEWVERILRSRASSSVRTGRLLKMFLKPISI